MPSASLPSTPVHRIVTIHSTDSEDELVDTDAESQASALVRNAKPAAQPKKTAGTPAKPPRLTKKALEAAEQQRREQYAQAFFDEMNGTVFGAGLPGETKLVWNKRLLSTAGRAKWQRYVPWRVCVRRMGADGAVVGVVQEQGGRADDVDRTGCQDTHVRR